MKKFKYQGTTDVFMQCKIRACAQQPCGVCTGTGDPRRELQTDLSPSEGEMFAPPLLVQVSRRDTNSMVFPQPAYDFPAMETASSSAANAAVAAGLTQPVQVSSEMSFSTISAEWALANRAALTATLRETLSLQADEDLVITAINRARRLQAGAAGAGVRIQFTVGVNDQSRADTAAASIQALSSAPAMIQMFTQILDNQLEARGVEPVS